MGRRYRLSLRLVVYALSVGVAAPGLADASPQTDAQCLLLTNAMMGQQQDPKAKGALFGSHFFYLGRLRTTVPSDKLAGVLADAAKHIVPGLAGKTMQACAAEAQAAEYDLTQALKTISPPPKHK